MIQIRNLHKSFGEKTVLKGVSLTIPDGSAKCIIGKSGCGKSVLLKHIVGLLEPDEGEVLVDGKKVHDMENGEIFEMRKQMGFVFQGSALFDSLNVFENVVLGLYEHGNRDETALENEAIRVLSAVGLLPELNGNSKEDFEKEWHILKFKKPADLSGGMRKRVGVARALVGSPRYIFYDEPTTGLDPVTSEQIDRLIADLSKKLKVTSIVITHDMFSVFRIADDVAMLDDGLVHFEGEPNDFIKSDDPIVREFLERYKF
ncbi:ATP-binding cassette domain-containing protein [Bacteroidetes/Chlorobi group bacterium ChocPot_Mid]|nr:MAG: ATP-binding cassette domain-containing protein [Bacteroidetes/Chlorobi group bacterium ChocPot_Mid]